MKFVFFIRFCPSVSGLDKEMTFSAFSTIFAWRDLEYVKLKAVTLVVYRPTVRGGYLSL